MALIYCVEDDDSIRQLILYSLKSGGFQAKGFDSADALFESLREQIPALILLDIMLPGESGLQILKKLKVYPAYEYIPVIMLTAKTSEFDKVQGLDLGSDDYITKPFGVMELLSRIHAVLRRTGGGGEESRILSCCGILIDPERRLVTVNGSPCELTYKEFELLSYLVKNKGLVLSRDKIMNAVWGFDFAGESRTVDMHIKSLRQKISEAGGPDVIKTVRSVGYKIEEPPV
ncbi:response regulator transcription factor [Papillibacter cinnamivorans]|uniref:Stage 0 sporulation protein A homolog n=1 Tax=Papillibacter cinnamivorans DSM 12816 TaxID=1122930 RepID=A0A1W2AAG0_9FIRM|nr:response regulator transcription factor [Papillibacter cinnamivorans]SMC57248.1 two-component system, OmpR family, alkaline phosphatase synthesis response regulator PhoP [Papillibacter cinnamivorans DSM 12816]